MRRVGSGSPVRLCAAQHLRCSKNSSHLASLHDASFSSRVSAQQADWCDSPRMLSPHDSTPRSRLACVTSVLRGDNVGATTHLCARDSITRTEHCVLPTLSHSTPRGIALPRPRTPRTNSAARARASSPRSSRRNFWAARPATVVLVCDDAVPRATASFLENFAVARGPDRGGIKRLAARSETNPRVRAGIGFHVDARLFIGRRRRGSIRAGDRVSFETPARLGFTWKGCLQREDQGGPQ